MIRFASALAGALVSASIAQASISIPTVPIGFAGNAPDPTTGYGSVGYEYRIGTTEVTNAQYAAFLNAVAATDTHALFNPGMAGTFGGITRSGVDGGYIYATIAGREAHPVNFVSFWDACRFTNWLHNGQPTGAQNNATTENGAYTLTPDAIANNSVTRDTGARWAVPSEDEWYKAAYHQPASQGGDADDYWLYPTSSNSIPTTAQANCDSTISNTTPVGWYPANFYGAFDMSGNMWEWNEAILSGSERGLRGGSFSLLGDLATFSASDSRGYFDSTNESIGYGFRVVQVPGPSSVVAMALGGLTTLRRRRW